MSIKPDPQHEVAAGAAKHLIEGAMALNATPAEIAVMLESVLVIGILWIAAAEPTGKHPQTYAAEMLDSMTEAAIARVQAHLGKVF